MTKWAFLEPVDLLFFRGHRPLNDTRFGELLMPPWPTVAAGALRGAYFAKRPEELRRWKAGEPTALGTLAEPDPEGFRLVAFHLARRRNGKETRSAPPGERPPHQGEPELARSGQIEMLFPLPADLVAVEDDDGHLEAVCQILPHKVHSELESSYPLPLHPVLAQEKPQKPASGYWLTEEGYRKYLRAEAVALEDLVKSDRLWKSDYRVGIRMDTGRYRAQDGYLYSTLGVRMLDGLGFLVGWRGAFDLPDGATLRFGGDGRAVRLQKLNTFKPVGISPSEVLKRKRCRIVLTTPGIFPDGWKLPGMDQEGNWRLGKVKAKVVAAAVGRYEVVSGWDLAHWRPKPAERAVQAGSVYWLDELEATEEALSALLDRGLWPEGADLQRRVEGFNRFQLAIWEEARCGDLVNGPGSRWKR